jgi:hypothetical protein
MDIGERPTVPSLRETVLRWYEVRYSQPAFAKDIAREAKALSMAPPDIQETLWQRLGYLALKSLQRTKWYACTPGIICVHRGHRNLFLVFIHDVGLHHACFLRCRLSHVVTDRITQESTNNAAFQLEARALMASVEKYVCTAAPSIGLRGCKNIAFLARVLMVGHYMPISHHTEYRPMRGVRR